LHYQRNKKDQLFATKIMKNLMNKFLRLPQVKATTGLSKSSIYARIAERRFPEQISTARG